MKTLNTLKNQLANEVNEKKEDNKLQDQLISALKKEHEQMNNKIN